MLYYGCLTKKKQAPEPFVVQAHYTGEIDSWLLSQVPPTVPSSTPSGPLFYFPHSSHRPPLGLSVPTRDKRKLSKA